MKPASNESTAPSRLRAASLLAILVVALVGLLPTEARAQNAQRDLARLRAQIQQELRARPEMRAALEEWQRARTEYEGLKRAVTYELSRDSAYLALRGEMWAAEDELAALQHYYRNGVVPMDQVLELAQRILDLRTQMSLLELEAIARQGELQEAREAYIDAARRVAELRREAVDLLRADPRFQRALDRLGQGGQSGIGGTSGLSGRKRP